MITFAKLLESGVLNTMYDDESIKKKSTYEICEELNDLSGLTSKIIDVIINLKMLGYLHEDLDGETCYYSLTDSGKTYALNLFQSLSNESIKMEKYYKKQSFNSNNTRITEENSIIKAGFGTNYSVRQDEGEMNNE